jgi:Flp pilus assembly protein TadG
MFQQVAGFKLGTGSPDAGLYRDTRGSVAIIAALAFPVLIGGVALGAEVGYWFLRQGEVQNAADVAAFSAAVRLSRGDNNASLNAVALQVSRDSGLDAASGTVEVHNPPISGASVGDATRVEVVLKENVPRYFTAIYSSDKVQVSVELSQNV